MMRADLDTLKRAIVEAAKRAHLSDDIDDIGLEPDVSGEGEFLRVVLRINQASGVDDEALETLLLAIESELGALDDRYASVRFSETV